LKLALFIFKRASVLTFKLKQHWLFWKRDWFFGVICCSLY